MQSSQIVPGNSAHESPSHANPIQQPTFWGSFCIVLCMSVLPRTTTGFRSCPGRQTLITGYAGDTITVTRGQREGLNRLNHIIAALGCGNSDVCCSFMAGMRVGSSPPASVSHDNVRGTTTCQELLPGAGRSACGAARISRLSCSFTLITRI